MNIIGAFRVNKVVVFGANIQYDLILLKDRFLFLKTGGQYADMRYVLASFLPILLFGLGLGLLGAFIFKSGLAHLFTVLGFIIGGTIGLEICRKFIKPRWEPILKQEKMNNIVEAELISGNKKNFQILYKDISKIALSKSSFGLNGPRTGMITIGLTKYDIAPGQNYTEIKQLVRNLPTTKSKQAIKQ
jgi:hypothetical protein